MPTCAEHFIVFADWEVEDLVCGIGYLFIQDILVCLTKGDIPGQLKLINEQSMKRSTLEDQL